jgi:hypothetical protein
MGSSMRLPRRGIEKQLSDILLSHAVSDLSGEIVDEH